MPRKPANELEKPKKEKKTTTKKTVNSLDATAKSATKKTTKSTSTKKATASSKKEPVAKKVTSKKVTPKDDTKKVDTKKATAKTTVKEVPEKKVATKKTVTKSTSKKTSSKKVAEKKSVTKKTTNKTTTKKATTKKASASKDLIKKIDVLEYYDLPYRYNQTVVKVLAQTPTTLFIYWDISDVDRANFATQFGDDFFNTTRPVLIVHNDTMHYSFEIEIDDFANSWYLHVNDSNCEYSVELGRKPKYFNNEKQAEIPNDYLYVASSNVIDAPNDHVLFDSNIRTVYFKDVKTNIVTSKDITSISFLRNMGKIYNLYDLQSGFNTADHCKMNLNNPSSGNPSSTFK